MLHRLHVSPHTSRAKKRALVDTHPPLDCVEKRAWLRTARIFESCLACGARADAPAAAARTARMNSIVAFASGSLPMCLSCVVEWIEQKRSMADRSSNLRATLHLSIFPANQRPTTPL